MTSSWFSGKLLKSKRKSDRADEEPAERIAGARLGLGGHRALEGPVLLVGDVGLQRQRPLGGLGEVLSPVEGVHPAPLAEGGQRLRVVQVLIGQDPAGHVAVLAEGPALELAGQRGEGDPGAGAEGVVELAVQLIGGPSRVGRASALAGNPVVAGDAGIGAAREIGAVAPVGRVVVDRNHRGVGRGVAQRGGTATTVSMPACTKIGDFCASNPVVTAFCPSRAPERKKVRLRVIGPPKLPWNRLKPRLVFLLNGSSLS